ncbi:sensor histidine kinase [Spongiactinospora sp. 9N601]|uniref:sensor histidine kinase n=1 Tax=Spongiactinospora sp. 9N601 TaxID=3375149 RepID=UPI00379CB7E8
MRQIRLDAWAGLAILLGCVAVGAPTLFGVAETLVPPPLWIAIYVALLAALLVAASAEERHPRRARIAYGLAVVLGWSTVLTAPEAGWLPILLVVVAAIGAYVVPPWAGAAVIAANTAVIAVALGRAGATGGVVLTGTLLYALIQASTVLSSIAIIRERRMRRELAEAHVELRAASVILADATRAGERLRIARELHDLIGHQLTVLTLELEVARHRDGDGARPHIERADQVARELLGDVRTTVGRLRADAPDLRESLTSVVRGIPGLDIGISIGDDVQAGEELTATLVRVVQEIVTNTIRHADATSLRIRIETAPDHTVRLTAADDGRGCPGVVPGNGLRGLTERVHALGGDVRLDGSAGFRLTARMPAP